VVDSEGTAGGIPPNTFSVVKAQSTNCITSQNQTDFTVHANFTTTVETCDPWGLRIKGGVAPYNITFVQINSPVVTNVTTGPNDDAYTYINRATPDNLLVAAVNDITGSMPGNAAQLDQQDANARAAAEAKSRRKRTAIIAGTLVPILLLSIGGIPA
ncbi:hypothetical protein MPER_04764, partial [Moniliophthora perniciosa FA553]